MHEMPCAWSWLQVKSPQHWGPTGNPLGTLGTFVLFYVYARHRQLGEIQTITKPRLTHIAAPIPPLRIGSWVEFEKLLSGCLRTELQVVGLHLNCEGNAHLTFTVLYHPVPINAYNVFWKVSLLNYVSNYVELLGESNLHSSICSIPWGLRHCLGRWRCAWALICLWNMCLFAAWDSMMQLKRVAVQKPR